MDAARHDLVGRALGGLGRDREDRQLDLQLRRHRGQVVERADDVSGVRGPDLLRVGVEHGHDVEPARVEPAILDERAAEVAEADHRRGPDAVDPQDAAEGVPQLVHAVADAGVAELAEEREVFADLGVADPELRPEPAAGDRRLPLGGEGFEPTEVQAHPADHRLGSQLLARRLTRGVRHGGGTPFAFDPSGAASMHRLNTHAF